MFLMGKASAVENLFEVFAKYWRFTIDNKS
jgi:hypothetical protein